MNYCYWKITDDSVQLSFWSKNEVKYFQAKILFDKVTKGVFLFFEREEIKSKKKKKGIGIRSNRNSDSLAKLNNQGL